MGWRHSALRNAPILGRAEGDQRGPDGDAAQASRPRLGSRRWRRAVRRRSPVGPVRSDDRWHSMQWAAHGQGLQPCRGDRLPQRTHVPYVPASSRARAASTSSSCGRSIAEGQVALLLEDLAGRRGLRAIRHLPGRDDRLAELGQEAVRVRPERLVRAASSRGRPSAEGSAGPGPTPSCAILPGSTTEDREMAIAIDPVCGMEVDTTTSLLSFEHDGRPTGSAARAACSSSRTTPTRTSPRTTSRRCASARDKSQLSGRRDTAVRVAIGHSTVGSSCRGK